MPDNRVHGDARNVLASQRITIETKGGGKSRRWEAYMKHNGQNEIHERLEENAMCRKDSRNIEGRQRR